jgi:hypothetical protein
MLENMNEMNGKNITIQLIKLDKRSDYYSNRKKATQIKLSKSNKSITILIVKNIGDDENSSR